MSWSRWRSSGSARRSRNSKPISSTNQGEAGGFQRRPGRCPDEVRERPAPTNAEATFDPHRRDGPAPPVFDGPPQANRAHGAAVELRDEREVVTLRNSSSKLLDSPPTPPKPSSTFANARQPLANARQPLASARQPLANVRQPLANALHRARSSRNGLAGHDPSRGPFSASMDARSRSTNVPTG